MHMDTHDLHTSTDMSPEVPHASSIPGEPGLQVIYRDDGLWLSHCGRRHWGVIIAAAAIGFLFLLAPLAFGVPSPEVEIAVRGVKVVSTLFGVCLLLLAAYQSAAGIEVRVDRRKIEKIHRWGAITLKRRAVLATNVEEVCIHKGPGSPRGAYTLICLGAFGSFGLLGGIRSREMLERLRRQIMLAAAIRPSGTH